MNSDARQPLPGAPSRTRRWGMNIVYIAAGIAYLGVLVAMFAWPNADRSTDSILFKFAVVSLVVFPVVLAVLLVIALMQSKLAKRLAGQEASAFVAPMNRAGSTVKALEALRGSDGGRSIGSYFVFAIRGGKVEFWAPSLGSDPLFSLDATDVVRVELGMTSFGAGMQVAAIRAVVHDPIHEGYELWIDMVPTFEGAAGMFPRYDPRVIEQLAIELREALEKQTRAALPEVAWVY